MSEIKRTFNGGVSVVKTVLTQGLTIISSATTNWGLKNINTVVYNLSNRVLQTFNSNIFYLNSNVIASSKDILRVSNSVYLEFKNTLAAFITRFVRVNDNLILNSAVSANCIKSINTTISNVILSSTATLSLGHYNFLSTFDNSILSGIDNNTLEQTDFTEI